MSSNAHTWDRELRESQRRAAGAGGGGANEDMAHVWGAALGDLLESLGIPAGEPATNRWESPDGMVFSLMDISGRLANEPPASRRVDDLGVVMVTFWLVISYQGRTAHVDRHIWVDPTSDSIRATIANTIDDLRSPADDSRIFVEAMRVQTPEGGEEIAVPIMPNTPAHRLLRALDSYTRDLLGDIIEDALE